MSVNRCFRYYSSLGSTSLFIVKTGLYMKWPSSGQRATIAITRRSNDELVAFHSQSAAAYPYCSSEYGGDIITTSFPFTVRYNTVYVDGIPALELLPHATRLPFSIDDCVVTTRYGLHIPGTGWLRQRHDKARIEVIQTAVGDLLDTLELVTSAIPRTLFAAISFDNPTESRVEKLAIPKVVSAYITGESVDTAVQNAFEGIELRHDGVSRELATYVCTYRELLAMYTSGRFGLHVALGATALVSDTDGSTFPVCTWSR